FARYVLNRGLIARNPIRVETMNRMLELHVREDGQITVDMGAPDFEPTSLPFTAPARQDFYTLSVPVAPGSAEQTEAKFQAVSMGNPHIVLTVDDCENAPVNTLGAVLCTWNKAFPQGVNVGFMQIIEIGRASRRERGENWREGGKVKNKEYTVRHDKVR